MKVSQEKVTRFWVSWWVRLLSCSISNCLTPSGHTALCLPRRRNRAQRDRSELTGWARWAGSPPRKHAADGCCSMYISVQMERRQWRNALCAPAYVWSLGLSAAFNYRCLQNRLSCFKDVKAWRALVDRSGVLDTVDVPTRRKLCVCEIPFTLFKNISAPLVSVNISASSLEMKHICARINQPGLLGIKKSRGRQIQNI